MKRRETDRPEVQPAETAARGQFAISTSE
jgi:hypothetical protein